MRGGVLDTDGDVVQQLVEFAPKHVLAAAEFAINDWGDWTGRRGGAAVLDRFPLRCLFAVGVGEGARTPHVAQRAALVLEVFTSCDDRSTNATLSQKARTKPSFVSWQAPSR